MPSPRSRAPFITIATASIAQTALPSPAGTRLPANASRLFASFASRRSQSLERSVRMSRSGWVLPGGVPTAFKCVKRSLVAEQHACSTTRRAECVCTQNLISASSFFPNFSTCFLPRSFSRNPIRNYAILFLFLEWTVFFGPRRTTASMCSPFARND